MLPGDMTLALHERNRIMVRRPLFAEVALSRVEDQEEDRPGGGGPARSSCEQSTTHFPDSEGGGVTKSCAC